MSESDLSAWKTRRDKTAEERGLDIEYPGPAELFVDIDDARSLYAFNDGLAILGELVTGHTITPSASGGDHFHIRVTLSRDIDAKERVALQAMLGSDRKRELLSWLTLEHDPEAEVVCFFEKPAEKANGATATAPPVWQEDPFS